MILNELGVDFTLKLRKDKPNIIAFNLGEKYPVNKDKSPRKTNVVWSNNVLDIKDEYVYDISANGTFIAGIGGIVAHNTDGFNFAIPDNVDEFSYVGKGLHRFTKKGEVYTGVAAPVAEFNDLYMDGRMGLDIDEYAEKIIQCGADVAIVVTPNNPTSLAVPKSDLIRLIEKLANHDCMLIVDESFIDFVRDSDQVTLQGEIERYQNLAIMKSMSKSYGIGGLRIGYLHTANSKFAEAVRKETHIWNINGFADSFLRLVPRYRREFIQSCELVRADCDELYDKLCSVRDMTVCRPDANFVFCRLPDSAPSGPEVTRRLFIEYNMLIKHCAGKTMPESDRYLRIASRTQAENRSLVKALKSVIGIQEEETEPCLIRSKTM